MEELINTYKQVKSAQKGTLRSGIRSIALDTLSLFGKLKNEERYLSEPRIQFLYFHHIFKDEVKNFEKIVAFLAKNHTFISHSEAVDRLLTNKIDKPYIAWSSDDGIQNNMLAANVLNTYGAKCCFYINPFSIGLDDPKKISQFCSEKLEMPPVAFLNWDEVSKLLSQGHEIGNHTLKHDMVSKLTTQEFEEDFLKADEILRLKCGQIKHFAYTYGKFEHFNKAAFDVVYKHGYESCTTAVRGCHINGKGPLKKEDVLLRRDQLIADWKLSHVTYFMINAVKQMDYTNNFLPNVYL